MSINLWTQYPIVFLPDSPVAEHADVLITAVRLLQKQDDVTLKLLLSDTSLADVDLDTALETLDAICEELNFS